MKVCYKKGEDYIGMNIKSFLGLDDYDDKRVSQSLKLSLVKKFNISLDEYLVKYYNKIIEKCRFCDTYSEYTLKFNFIPYDKGYLITDFNINYNKYYCRGKNKTCKGRRLNPNSVEFISTSMDMTNEDALNYIHNRNKSPFYIENHKDINAYKKSQSRDISFFGNDEDRYKDYIKKLSKSHTLEHYVSKYGDEKGKSIYNTICCNKDSSSLLFFIKKHKGDEEMAICDFNIKNNKTKHTLDNFILRYGEDGVSEFLKYDDKRKTCLSIDNFVRLYGEINGISKREEWLSKIRKSNFYSKSSYLLFSKVEDILNITGYYGNSEYFLRDKEKNIVYFYDYTNIEYNFIIEYNGRIWHPDKNIYSDDEWRNWKHPFNKSLQAIDIFNKDKRKLELARTNGFDVLVIWDFDEDKENKIIKFIKERIK